jgi:RimJ/RimL family protein N-acetyltransferase
MALTINRLTENDLAGLHKQIRNSVGYLPALGWIEYSFWPEFRHHFRQLIKMPDLLIFVIRQDDQVIGAIEIEDRPDSYFIGYWIGINFRRKGIMRRCILDVIQHDLPLEKPCTARVGLDNTASIKLLEKLNFTETSRDTEYIYYSKPHTTAG